MSHTKYRTKRMLRNAVRLRELHGVSNGYKVSLSEVKRKKRRDGVTLAVIIHLYYVEAWPQFKKKLNTLSKVVDFDLYITVPPKSASFNSIILSDFKDATVLTVPNMGRDVLPFLVLAREISKKKYIYVLKLHSKKSTHRTDGGEWMAGMLDSLIPDDKKRLSAIVDTLNGQDTGIIGPEGQYVSLSVNFEANGVHMTYILSRLFSERVAYDSLQLQRPEYGFFAGTMFWARFDAISKLIDTISSIRYFESEAGQIDATFAHAVERMLCVVPEIDGKKIFEANSSRIKELKYSDGVVPDWSSVYIGPKGN